MKKIILLIVIALVMKPIIPVIDYAINYEYISKVLCVNKEKPKMHCNGKCHLMKELAKAASDDIPKSSDKKTGTQLIEVLFCNRIEAILFAAFNLESKVNINKNYSNLYCFLNSNSVFRPPAFIA